MACLIHNNTIQKGKQVQHTTETDNKHEARMGVSV